MVHFLLDIFDHPLVAGLEHVGETALHLQVFLHRQLVLGLVAEDVLALDHLIQRPYAGFHRHPGDLHQLFTGIAPAAGAGSHHVQEGRARGVDGLIGFFADILEIAGERGLGRVGDSVGRHDPGQVFLLLHLAGDHTSLRGSGGVGKAGR